ncbi:MAG: ABC transporter ATP-binding protein [Candidatus Berkiella sp.]
MNSFLHKVLSFFNRTEKLQLGAIMGGTVIMGFVEMISVAAIMPFIAIAVQPSIIESSQYLNSFYHYFSFGSYNRFLLFIGGVVFCLLLFGNLFSAFMSWVMIRFCYSKGKKLSSDLFKKYLAQPYLFFLNRNSSELSKNILAEVDRFTIGILSNGLQMFSKIVMALAIFTLLVIVKPYLAMIVMSVLGGTYVVLLKIIRKKLVAAGKVSSFVNGVRYQTINEALGAIKELKVLGREEKFITCYQDNANKYARSEALSQLSPLVAKYTIEAVAFGSMLLIALYLIATQGISEFIPLLALYALSGYRLMPAMQQVFSGYTLFKYHQSAIEVLFNEQQLADYTDASKSNSVSFKQSLTLSHVSYQYPQTEKWALSQVDIEIPLHATIGIVGASGAGKTTLIDIILGLLEPQGEMRVDGQKIDKPNVRSWQKMIGYVPQNIVLIDSTIKQNIALGIDEKDIDIKAVEKAARLANLHDFIVNELPLGYETSAGERGVRLSGGQRQRIGIARALYHDPELLLFDEATSALDGINEKIIIEAISSLAKRKTIILVAHRLNTVKDCDEIYVLSQGRVEGKGTFKELIATNLMFQNLANAYVTVEGRDKECLTTNPY